MSASSHWLGIGVVSMVILYIAQAPKPTPPSTIVYIKWIKAQIRIINKYFNAVNSGPDPRKPLSKIDNLAYHSFVFIQGNEDLDSFKVSKSIWHKHSVHVRIFFSLWKNEEKMMLEMIIPGLHLSNISILDITIYVVLRIISKGKESYNSTYLNLFKTMWLKKGYI